MTNAPSGDSTTTESDEAFFSTCGGCTLRVLVAMSCRRVEKHGEHFIRVDVQHSTQCGERDSAWPSCVRFYLRNPRLIERISTCRITHGLRQLRLSPSLCRSCRLDLLPYRC